MRPGRPSIFPYETPEAVWNEHRETTRGRDLDITGMSYPMLELRGPQQWPLPAGARTGKARLYEDGRFFTPSGKAQFFVGRYQATVDKIDAHYPLRLTTGRLRDHWHGMSRTGSVARLFGHVAEPRLSINGDDLTRRGLKDGELVKIQSNRGAAGCSYTRKPTIRSGRARSICRCTGASASSVAKIARASTR